MAALNQMKRILLLLFLCIAFALQGQDNDYLKEMEAYRNAQNAQFLDANTSPLSEVERSQFTGHEFFPVNENYRVIAKFEATPNARPFPMKTSTGATQLYRRLGILHFTLEEKELSLEAYLRVQGFGMASKVNYVFLPVVDLTTGSTTYGAGRYLHFEGIPEGDEWIIDFNKLYNPLCAYNEQYECPLVPEPNHLPLAIEAGVKGF